MLKLVRAAALAGATLMAAGGVHAETVIRAVMHSPLRLTDPHATTAYITTWHGYMIYDTLLATDANNKVQPRSEEHTSELQSREDLVCRLLLEKKNQSNNSLNQ